MATLSSQWGSPARDEELTCWRHAERLVKTLPAEWVVICARASAGWFLPVVVRSDAGVVARSESIEDEKRFSQLLAFLERIVPELEQRCRPTECPLAAG